MFRRKQVFAQTAHISADDYVALEVDPAALGKLEHGEDLRLGHPVLAVVDKLGHDLGVGAALVVDELNRVVGVAEAEAPLHLHAELTCEGG